MWISNRRTAQSPWNKGKLVGQKLPLTQTAPDPNRPVRIVGTNVSFSGWTCLFALDAGLGQRAQWTVVPTLRGLVRHWD